MAAYFVTVQRRGISPLRVTMLVRAHSRDGAAELATAIAERDRGGLFEARRVRRATEAESSRHPLAYDDLG